MLLKLKKIQLPALCFNVSLVEVRNEEMLMPEILMLYSFRQIG